MTQERKQQLTELKGLVKTASIGLDNAIRHVLANELTSELDSNWQAGLGNLRECETTLENLQALLGHKLDGKTGEALDNAMFEE